MCEMLCSKHGLCPRVCVRVLVYACTPLSPDGRVCVCVGVCVRVSPRGVALHICGGCERRVGSAAAPTWKRSTFRIIAQHHVRRYRPTSRPTSSLNITSSIVAQNYLLFWPYEPHSHKSTTRSVVVWKHGLRHLSTSRCLLSLRTSFTPDEVPHPHYDVTTDLKDVASFR